jgi:hypothetical protein
MVWKQPTGWAFRVFVLPGAGTSRVVIDVAHKWRA